VSALRPGEAPKRELPFRQAQKAVFLPLHFAAGSGCEVVEAMEVVTLEGETPTKRIDVTRARVVPVN